MTPYEIPLTPAPQKFLIDLAGATRQLRVYWCKYQQSWVVDINTSGGDPIVQGIPLVTGVDLLAQHRHLELGGSLIAQTDFEPAAVPTFKNLGVLGRVFFVVG